MMGVAGWLLVALVALLSGAASADPSPQEAFVLVDAGRDLGGAVAVVVVSPGVAPAAYVDLVGALEDAGLDAWTVQLRSGAAWPVEGPGTWAGQVVLPEAVRSLRSTLPRAEDLVLVGEGMGGVLALLAAPRLEPPPRGVAVVGTPLSAAPSELVRFLASQPLGPLVTLPDPHLVWRGRSALGLLWGEPLPPLEPMSAGLARDWYQWLLTGPPLEPDQVRSPVLVAVGALDRLAPPESAFATSHQFADARYVRFGLLRLDLADPSHGDLIRAGSCTAWVASWLADRAREGQ